MTKVPPEEVIRAEEASLVVALQADEALISVTRPQAERISNVRAGTNS